MQYYRKELDGLRSFAIIPVVLFHGGFEIVSGGFIGVDIFFVISGYLITSIILRELNEKKFSLIEFYKRRVRRILPALFTMLLFCVPLSYIWLTPHQLDTFFKSLLSVLFFVSNVFFWLSSDYFAPESMELPLIHTWSLAVEEQFYAFFPLVMLFFYRKRGKKILFLFLASAFVSVCIAHWASSAHSVAGFYLIVTRAWELLIGSACAFTPTTFRKGHKESLSLVGLICIVSTFFLYNETTLWPSYYALLPTVGTVLIIVFAHQDTLVGKLLSIRPLRGIGLISYSVYLWHQPIFVYFNVNNVDLSNYLLKSLMIVLPFTIGWVSWRCVEMPFRTRQVTLIYLIPVSFLVLLIGGIGVIMSDPDSRLPPNVEYWNMGDKTSKVGLVCSPVPNIKYDLLQTCEFGDTNGSQAIGLYGDSHAKALSYELDSFLKEHRMRGVSVKLGDCSVIPNIIENNPAELKYLKTYCRPAFDQFLQWVKNEIDVIIISSRWTFRLFPVPGYIEELTFDNGEGGHELENYREYGVFINNHFTIEHMPKRTVIKEFIRGLVGTGKQIVVIDPIPEVGWNVAKENFSHFSKTGKILSELSVSSQSYDRRHRFFLSVLGSLDQSIKQDNYKRVRMRDVFCDSFKRGRCVAQYKTVPLYYDDDHLSSYGARLVINRIVKNGGLNIEK